MLKTIYNHLKAHLAGVSSIEDVNYFLGQYDVETSDSVLYATPALYIEFDTIEWQQLAKNIQKAELRFAIHLVTESNFDDDERILDTTPDHLGLSNEVFKKLQGHRLKQGDQILMETIVRVSSTFDHVLMPVIVTKQEFTCIIFDYSAYPTTTTTTIDTITITPVIQV